MTRQGRHRQETMAETIQRLYADIHRTETERDAYKLRAEQAEADAETWRHTYVAWRDWCERNHPALAAGEGPT